MLDDFEPFIVGTVVHEVGAEVLAEVGLFSSAAEGAENKLETEQEREQEQEQQKEVKARRDQQVEIEKFVEREYSRNEERPTPWPLQALLRGPPPSGAAAGAAAAAGEDHPFYALRHFALRHQESLEMPPQLLCSRNYFNPDWNGLRRIKNVVMALEWAPSAEGEGAARRSGGRRPSLVRVGLGSRTCAPFRLASALGYSFCGWRNGRAKIQIGGAWQHDP